MRVSTGARKLCEYLVLNLNILVGNFWFFVDRFLEGLSEALIVFSVLFFFDLPLHVTNSLEHVILPSTEAHSEEHLGEEGICSGR